MAASIFVFSGLAEGEGSEGRETRGERKTNQDDEEGRHHQRSNQNYNAWRPPSPRRVGETRIKTKPSDNEGLSKIRAVAPAQELLDVIAGERREVSALPPRGR